jgi:hypothetical protein
MIALETARQPSIAERCGKLMRWKRRRVAARARQHRNHAASIPNGDAAWPDSACFAHRGAAPDPSRVREPRRHGSSSRAPKGLPGGYQATTARLEAPQPRGMNPDRHITFGSLHGAGHGAALPDRRVDGRWDGRIT